MLYMRNNAHDVCVCCMQAALKFAYESIVTESLRKKEIARTLLNRDRYSFSATRIENLTKSY